MSKQTFKSTDERGADFNFDLADTFLRESDGKEVDKDVPVEFPIVMGKEELETSQEIPPKESSITRDQLILEQSKDSSLSSLFEEVSTEQESQITLISIPKTNREKSAIGLSINHLSDVTCGISHSSQGKSQVLFRNYRQEHTKPTVGRLAFFVRRPTKFSQCVPHRRLKLILVGFFRPIRNVESASELVGPSGHLIIPDWLFSYCHLLVRKGISSHAGPELTCYLAVGCLALVWCVRPTLDTGAADVSQPCCLLSSPLVRQRRLGVFWP
ncbi:hypothetical protein DPX16_1549 [Anabarilius grahami]|uniref:Uncharacterized protein n=1 Tax=Anabarilius grahami TaxID=495550 RepID=A0A3N0XSL8_ANAGA|nr:hypothetical protein DPX16_1549 [Anabarilius grahami]